MRHHLLAAGIGLLLPIVATVGLWTGQGVAQEKCRFNTLTPAFLSLLADKISTVVTPAPPGLVMRTPEELQLTDEEKEVLKTMDIKVVYLIVTPDVTELLNKAGADEVLATVGQPPLSFLGAETQEKQLSQLDSLIAQPGKYSFIMVQPYGTKLAAKKFKELSNLGVPLVFLWTPSEGVVGTKGFVGLVLDDAYSRGYASAEMLVEALRGKGKVAMINNALDCYTTNLRTQGAHDAFAKYPGIEIVAERAFTHPAQAGDIARGILSAHPDIDGIWVVWMDPPAFEVSDAVKDLGMADHIVITTTDLGGEAGARRIADDSDPIIGTVDANSVAMGECAALLGLGYLAGRHDLAGSFVPVPAYPIAKANLEEGFFFSQRKPLPDDIKQMLNK